MTVGLAAAVFHDVDLTAQRPLHVIRVEPEGGPHPLGGWQIDPRFESAGTEEISRDNQARLIRFAVARHVDGRELQIAIGNRDLIWVIVLLLVVVAVSSVECFPLLVVERCSIELVVPNQFPTWHIGKSGRSPVILRKRR